METSARSRITRALCIVGLMEPLTMLGAFVLILLVATRAIHPLNAPQALTFIIIVFAPKLTTIGLSIWRRCDRCTKEIFADRVVWPNRERHHRARKLWRSYRSAAMFEYARTGTTHCQWCGHEDGVAPDYVVLSSIR